MLSKYNRIVYPFFGMNATPTNVYFDGDILKCRIKDDVKIIDDSSIELSEYLSRHTKLFLENKNCIVFDYTCRNLQELVHSKTKWGLDNSGKIFDISKREQFKCKWNEVRKIKGNLIWLKGVQKPYVMPMENIDADTSKYALIAYVNYQWIIVKFSVFREEKKIVWL